MSFSFRFFRFIRKHARPIEPNTAVKWKNRLNMMYIFFAWNAVAIIVMYHSFGKGKDKDVIDGSAESWARFLKLPDTVNIIKMKGFTAQESYKYRVPVEEKPEQEKTELEEKLT